MLIFSEKLLYLRMLSKVEGEPIQYEEIVVRDYSQRSGDTLIVDAQFDSLRELSLWCLLYISSINIYALELMKLDLNSDSVG